MRITIIIFFFLLFFDTLLYSQSSRKYVESADDFMKNGDYYSAALNYFAALEIDSSSIDLMNKYAEACRLGLDFKKAEHWYKSIYDIDKGKKYPDVMFWLAMTKKSNGKYKEAQKLFTKYYKKYKKKKSYFVQKARQEADACEYAQYLVTNGNDLKIVHLDTLVNTVNADFGAYELNDSSLFFASLRGQSVKLYQQSKDSLIGSISSLNSITDHVANIAFSKDGQRFYFTECKVLSPTETHCEIYVSHRADTTWQKPIKLNDEINLKGYTATQPSIGYNDSIGEILFFVSDRPGGQGKLDIWASNLNQGKYGTPYNLGLPINSIDNEVTPYYCNRCQMLYFSSDWHKGLGGFDVFRSIPVGNHFSEPENMGYPINSSLNDLYFTINPNDTKAYFTSNRPGSFFNKSETCCNDIYRIDFPKNTSVEIPPKADSTQVMVGQLKLLVPLTLYFHNDQPDNKTLAITTTKNYQKTYEDYIALKDQYQTEYAKGLRGDAKERAVTNIQDFFEDSVDVGMQNLEKFAQLLTSVLKNGEQVTMTMKGYCSPLASTEYNVNLAKRRIASLKNYFNEYNNGFFKHYINNTTTNEGKLEIFEEDIGELKSSNAVSDNPNDTKNSVYSITAAAERKIQIIAISAQPLLRK